MTPPDYSSDDFAQLVGSKTFCGPNAWKRLMTWLEVDQPFQLFMQDWNSKIAPVFHLETTPEQMPDIQGILENHFDHLYPAQFILRLCQLTDEKRKHWLMTALNTEQQEILFHWLRDSKIDTEKGYIADHWQEALNADEYVYEGTPLYGALISEIFREISKLAGSNTKRIR